MRRTRSAGTCSAVACWHLQLMLRQQQEDKVGQRTFKLLRLQHSVIKRLCHTTQVGGETNDQVRCTSR
jgi:hypothetical protein